MFLLALSAVSCFDDQYDLKKDIDLTVSVGGEKMVVPLGDTEVITLDEIIDESETFKLGDDGIYAFKKKDEIDDVQIDVEAVNIDVDDPEIDPIEVELEENTRIDPFNIDLNDTEFSVEVQDIHVDQSALPEIEMGIQHTVNLDNALPGVDLPNQVLNLEAPTQNISVNLSASTFNDIKEVKEVWFGDESSKQQVNFEVDASAVGALFASGSTQLLKKMTVSFPTDFVLGVPEAYKDIMSIENGSTLVLKDVDLSKTLLLRGSFYVEKFVHAFDPNHLNYQGSVSFSIEYEVGGKVGGDVKSTANLSARLFVGDGSNEPFKLDKALVVTKDVEVNVGSGSFKFDAEVTGLEDLSEVKSLTFKDNSVFELNIGQVNLPFDFYETSRFIIEIPKILEVEEKVLPDGVTFDAVKNHLIITGPILNNVDNTIQMTLKGINFAKEGKSKVKEGKLVVDETLLYYAESLVDGQPVRDKLVVKGGRPLFTDQLLGKNFSVTLRTKCGTVGAGENMVEVENANVIVNAVSSDVDTSADFDVHEEDMPKEVKMVKEVYLAHGALAELRLKVDFRELPKDIKKGISMAPMTIDLPKFIIFDDNPDIDENNVMTLRETFVPNAGNDFTYKKVVKVKGLDFTRIPEYADGLKIGDDHVLSIPKEYARVSVKGKVTTNEGEEVNSKNFETFKVYPTLEISKLTIGRVIGKVDPEIDPVEELVDLDLDDDLNFLKNDGNELHIKNPIINIELKNTVGVPVNLDLHISGYKNGCSDPIEGSDVYANTEDPRYKDFRLYPAIDGKTVTTNILISRDTVKVQPSEKYQKFVNVVIPDLSNLLVHLPDLVKFELVPTVDQTVEHDVDITPTPNLIVNGKETARFTISGDYDVTVPLVFEALDIDYTDSIDNLNDDLWDFLDIAISAELDVTAELFNQLPADLNLTATAVDRMGKELNTIHTEIFVNGEKDAVIPGVSVEGHPVKVPIKIELRAVDTDELKKLDKLRFNVKAKISQTKNGVPLKATQSVQFKDVKAYVKKVNLDLN